MKLKISILIYSMSNGGAEKIVSILLEELKDKYDITLVLMNSTIFYTLPDTVKVIYIENSKINEKGLFKLLKLPLLAFKYKNICFKNNIKISLSFMNRPNYISVLAKLLGSKVKTIISERAMPSLQHGVGIQGKINKILIKYLYPYSDIITANSFGNSLDLKDKFLISNVITIHNHFDIKKIQLLSKEPLELKKDKFTFITIGRLDKGKNHQLMISAMVYVNAILYIIGEGELKNELKSLIQNLKLEKKVFLLGKQKNPYKYLLKADSFVFTSNHEGFPNVLVEALACNLPIISTDCQSGPREILAPKSDFNFRLVNNIEVAEYGILTPVNDMENLKKSMQLMINDSALRYNYKNKAMHRIEELDKDIIVKKWINIIEGKQ